MPTNLPPNYFAAEKVYKSARTPEEKIAALEEMLAIMPHHKGTDKLRAGLNRKIAQLKLQQETKTKTKHGSVYSIDRQGAAQIILVGMPNTGKSSVLAALTHATPDIANYPYTTSIPSIGMMPYEDIQIQMIDLPPLGEEIRKLPFYNLLRNADAHLMVVDGSRDAAVEVQLVLEELEEGKVLSPVNEGEVPVGAVLKKMLIVANKCENADCDSVLEELGEVTGGKIGTVAVSIRSGMGMDELRRKIFDLIDVVRVYTKVPHKKPDLKDPYVLPRGSTIMDLATAIHHDFAENLKFARVWGSSKFEGQQVQRDHVLEDGDVVELHM